MLGAGVVERDGVRISAKWTLVAFEAAFGNQLKLRHVKRQGNRT